MKGNKLVLLSFLMMAVSNPRILETSVHSQSNEMGFLKRAYLRLEKSMKTLCGDKTAFAAMLMMGIMAIIVGAAMLYVGLYITVTISDSIPAVNDSAYNTSLANVKNNVNTAFTVLGLALLVGGFGVVIYTLRTGFMGGEVR